eukprot:scaffold21670_cov110-Isochrysis_galbana.AAC.2
MMQIRYSTWFGADLQKEVVGLMPVRARCKTHCASSSISMHSDCQWCIADAEWNASFWKAASNSGVENRSQSGSTCAKTTDMSPTSRTLASRRGPGGVGLPSSWCSALCSCAGAPVTGAAHIVRCNVKCEDVPCAGEDGFAISLIKGGLLLTMIIIF